MYVKVRHGSVMLRVAKHLGTQGMRSFASLRMTIRGLDDIRGLDVREGKAWFCHAECNEASRCPGHEILRFAQDDNSRVG